MLRPDILHVLQSSSPASHADSVQTVSWRTDDIPFWFNTDHSPATRKNQPLTDFRADCFLKQIWAIVDFHQQMRNYQMHHQKSGYGVVSFSIELETFAQNYLSTMNVAERRIPSPAPALKKKNQEFSFCLTGSLISILWTRITPTNCSQEGSKEILEKYLMKLKWKWQNRAQKLYDWK